MPAFVRAAVAAALVLLLCVPAAAADKPFKRDDLADAAIKLEAQIKPEAGQVTKPLATLRRDADAAFQRNDPRARCRSSGRSRRGARTTAPTGCVSPAVPHIRPRRTIASARRCSSAPRPPPTSPISTPAMPARKPTASCSSPAPLPIASCGGRRSTRCASRSSCARSPRCGTYERMRAITASACSITPSMPMPPRRACASSSPRTCPASAPTSRRSWRSPARTSRRCRRRRTSSASRGSSTASATPSRCAPACPRQ